MDRNRDRAEVNPPRDRVVIVGGGGHEADVKSTNVLKERVL